jgi:hypothetical protein
VYINGLTTHVAWADPDHCPSAEQSLEMQCLTLGHCEKTMYCNWGFQLNEIKYLYISKKSSGYKQF